jgi:hypothetical protein
MTVTAFDRLLYTDCRAGTGRGAGGGFQVQAQSAGVDSAQVKMAVGWLLYEAPNAWIVQRRPVEEFPLGFAHASVAGYGTSQSRYDGTEATGARQGNHLADCLLTRDLALYGPTRPAQMWQSQLWRSDPWGTTDCPQFDGTPPLGPLTVEAIADWLRGSPVRAAALARVVSVLEEPAGQRVIIAASTPDEAMRWIAAATLLLPIRAALEVSFKVFCANPMQASHRIVAVHKELNPQVVPGRGDSAFVLDAEGAASDEVEVSRRARFWVDLFAGAEDPYDVIDAVELAGQLSAATRQAQADALITSWAVTVPDSRLDDPAALFRWLSAAGPALQKEHGPAVVRRILATDPPAKVLREIDGMAAVGRIDIDRPALRSLLLTAEIAEIRAGGHPPTEVLTAVAADDDARSDAQRELSSAIVMDPDPQADPQVDLLLRLARRHLIEPQLAPLSDRLQTFVIGWIDNPARDYSPADWALRDEILALALDVLHKRLARDGIAEVMRALQLLWRYFADWQKDPDPADPLYCHIQVAALPEPPSRQRLPRLSALIRQALSGPAPASATNNVQHALIDWQALGPAEALLVLSALPAALPVAPEVIETAVAEIRRVAERPTTQALDALRMLHDRGVVLEEQPFSGLITADRHVLGFVRATTSPKFLTDTAYGRRYMAQLIQADPPVVIARLGALLQACLDLSARGLGARLISELAAPVPRLLIDRWGQELGGPQTIQATIEGVWWHEDSEVKGNLKARIADVMAGYGAGLGPADREQWFLLVREGLVPEYHTAWTRLAGYEVAKPHRIRRGRAKDT